MYFEQRLVDISNVAFQLKQTKLLLFKFFLLTTSNSNCNFSLIFVVINSFTHAKQLAQVQNETIFLKFLFFKFFVTYSFVHSCFVTPLKRSFTRLYVKKKAFVKLFSVLGILKGSDRQCMVVELRIQYCGDILQVSIENIKPFNLYINLACLFVCLFVCLFWCLSVCIQ